MSAPAPRDDRVIEHDPRRRAHAQRAALPVLNLNLTPMIDVVFLLMIYFLLITQFQPREEAQAYELPKEGDRAEPTDPFELPVQPVRIAVESFGDGGQAYRVTSDLSLLAGATSARALGEALRAELDATMGDDQRFVIEPAREARWEHTLAVFNAVRGAGYPSIRLAPPGEGALRIGDTP
ncbi:MAG: biopolymer transporter ExbD [Planctomycetota bacterium]